MNVTINTLDGRSHATHLTERDLHRLLQGMEAKDVTFQINANKSDQTYIIASTISSITVSE